MIHLTTLFSHKDIKGRQLDVLASSQDAWTLHVISGHFVPGYSNSAFQAQHTAVSESLQPSPGWKLALQAITQSWLEAGIPAVYPVPAGGR